MKILHVFKTYYPETHGGIEQVIKQISEDDFKKKIEHRIFTLTDQEKQVGLLKEGNVEIFRGKRWLKIASCDIGYPKFFLHFKKLSKWADIIHYHFPWPFSDLLHFYSNHKKPSVLTYHSDIVRQTSLLSIYKPLMNQFLKSVTRIVATSPHYLATSDILTKHTEKITIIPIGIDEKSYPIITKEKLSRLKNKFGNNFFLFMGVMRYYKGIHILIDAMKNNPCKIVIAGSGPEELQLRAQTQKLKLNNITFTGFVDEETKIGLIKLSNGIVFPSHLRAEAFGVSLLEGAMHCKPLICADIDTGTTHINKNDITGIVINPNNPTELKQAMIRLQNNEALRKKLGNGARNRFEKYFTGHKMRNAYINIYQNIICK